MLIEDLQELLSDIIGDNFKIKVVKGELVIFTGKKEDISGEIIDLLEDQEYDESEDDFLDEMPEDIDEED